MPLAPHTLLRRITTKEAQVFLQQPLQMCMRHNRHMRVIFIRHVLMKLYYKARLDEKSW